MLLFVPYSKQHLLKNFPVITYMLVIITITVFIFQMVNKQQLNRDIADYCQSIHLAALNNATNSVSESMNKLPADQFLCELMIKRLEQRPDLSIQQVIHDYFWFNDRSPEKISEMIRFIKQQYEDYKTNYTQNLDKMLMYFPRTPDVLSMFTSAMAHASIWHLLGNLVFLLAFAPAIEVRLERRDLFVFLIAFSIVITSLSTSLAAMFKEDALPALGLSGVVMSMIGLYVAMMPKNKIPVFVWILTLFKTIYIPAWIFAIVYIGIDLLNLVLGMGAPGINLVAHVSGALSGYIAGLLLVHFKLLSRANGNTPR